MGVIYYEMLVGKVQKNQKFKIFDKQLVIILVKSGKCFYFLEYTLSKLMFHV